MKIINSESLLGGQTARNSPLSSCLNNPAEVAVTNVWLRDLDLLDLIMCVSWHVIYCLNVAQNVAQGCEFRGSVSGVCFDKVEHQTAFTYTWPRTTYQTNLLKNKYHITIVPHHCGDCETLHFLLDIGPNRNQTINEGLATILPHLPIYIIVLPCFQYQFHRKKNK